MSRLTTPIDWQRLYREALAEPSPWREIKLRALDGLWASHQPDPKREAQAAVNRAVAEGDLSPISTRRCEDCGGQAHHYHHDSYAAVDRLKVTPLCYRCHARRHRPKAR